MPMTACPHCGFANTEGRAICKSCQRDLRAPAAALSATPLAPSELIRLLDAEIMRQVGSGWRLQARTETTAQLVREVGNVNVLVLLVLLCLAILPGIIYAAIAKRTSSMYIAIDAYGALTRVIDGQGAVPPVAPAGAPALSSAPSPNERLAVLDTMRAEGRITEEEYAERRTRILDGI